MQHRLLHPSLLPLAAISALLMASTPALAGWSFEVGAGGGQSEVQKYECLDCLTITSVDDSDIALVLTAQARYSLAGESSPWIPSFGFATEYVDLGDLKARGPGVRDTLEASAWSLMFSPSWALGRSFEFFTEVGVARWQQKVSYVETATGGFAASDDFDDVDAVFGVGIGYYFGQDQRLGVRTKWLRFKDVGDPDDPELSHQSDIDLYAVTFNYRFGI